MTLLNRTSNLRKGRAQWLRDLAAGLNLGLQKQQSSNAAGTSNQTAASSTEISTTLTVQTDAQTSGQQGSSDLLQIGSSRETATSRVTPGVTSRGQSPGATSSSLSLGVTSSSLSPTVTNSHLSPSVTSRGLSPGVTNRGSSPGVTSSHLSPSVTSTGLSPGVTSSQIESSSANVRLTNKFVHNAKESQTPGHKLSGLETGPEDNRSVSSNLSTPRSTMSR